MDEEHSPTSPLLTGLPPHEFYDELHGRPQRPPSLRHQKERRDSTYGGISSRELAKMLVAEELESTNLRKMLAMLSNQLRDETQRADDADRRTRDAVVRLKANIEAKLIIEQEAARVNEELRLYKIQLDNAQKEIYKAQNILNDVESQRIEAEGAAARARDTARKLKEQRLIDIAREEGRRMGIEEGLARAQDAGYRQSRAQGRLMGNREESMMGEIDDDDDSRFYDEGNSTSSGPSRSPSPPRDHSPPKSPTPPSSRPRSTRNQRPPNFTDAPDRDVPIPAALTTPVGIPTPQLASPPFIRVQSPPDVRPVQITRTMPSPGPLHTKSSIPPDGWIPVIDEGGIRLPPPHELSPRPSPPRSQPHLPPVHEQEEPILMMRPPASDPHVSDHESAASPHRRPRHVRRRSSDSATSTTISQLDIVSPPNVGPVRVREPVLSAIIEERSSATPSPNPSAHVSLHTNSPYQPFRSADSLHPPVSSSTSSSLHKSSSQESDEYKFDIVPPSRPTSKTYTPENTVLSGGMLSAEDANNRPLPSKPPEEPPAPQAALVNQLPPGFVPFTPGGTSISLIGVPVSPHVMGSTTRSQLAGATPNYSFHNIPGGRVIEEPDTEPVIPTLSSRSKKSYSAKSGSTTTTTKDRYRKPPSSDSDEEVSSALSSDSLTTPPTRGKTPLPIYAQTPSSVGVPLPPSTVVSSGRTAARIPLPPSTVAATPKSTRSRTSSLRNQAPGGRRY